MNSADRTDSHTQAGRTRPRVVIVGAGFGGIYAAKTLKRAPVDVLMIDQHNYHTFQPLLYQVATAQLEPEEVAASARGVFHHQKNFRFRLGTVVDVDWEQKCIRLADSDPEPFDYLILAAGAVYNDFGIKGVKRHGLFLKSLTEAVNIRSHILRQFERASADPSLIEKGILNFVIVGGGPTGVEMAGAMVELFERVLPKDFPELDVSRARIIILEMLDTLMPPYSEASRKYTERVLRKRGVDIRLENAVAEVRDNEVELKSGEVIPTQTLLWAGGVRGSPLVDTLDVALTRGHRVKVDPDLSIPGHPYAFVVGDMSGATAGEDKPYPQLAPVAIQQGKHAARQVMRRLEGQPGLPFDYFDKGTMAIIGRNAGIAELSKAFGGLKLRGFLGWLGWLFIHLLYLVGFKTRVNVFLDWAYSYVTFDRSARLIADMEPSPAEIANRKEELVSAEALARQRESEVQTA